MSSPPSSVPSIVVAPDLSGDVVHQYAAGELIQDKYQLTKPLGRGGMGSVWQARNLALDSDVAIKIILNDGRQAQLADRLLREARASARLNHPGIVRVFDVGETAYADAFLVMELLQGTSLADRLTSDGRLAATRAVQLFLPLAEALESAHQRGIIHRDLKPDNIFLAETPGHIRPKVLDFGVAMDLNLDAHRITQAGTLLGSPAYMSPEQARGEATLDHRTDVWSFCVSLYETLTQETPFGDDGNYYVLLDRIVKAPPTPTTHHVAGDEALWQILERGLQKHPDDRWPTMHSLGVALAMWLEDQEIVEDILGQGLVSTWLAPDSDNGRISLTDPPRASSRISGALRRISDRPTAAPELLAPISSRPPAARVSSSAHTTLASTLRPPEGAPSGPRRWLLPAGALLAIACGAVIWGMRASGHAPHASANDPSPSQPVAAVERVASNSGLAAPSAAETPSPTPSVPPRQSAESAPATAPSEPRGVARQAKAPQAPPAAPSAPAQPRAAEASAPTPQPTPPKTKPKLGDDLGF